MVIVFWSRDAGVVSAASPPEADTLPTLRASNRDCINDEALKRLMMMSVAHQIRHESIAFEILDDLFSLFSSVSFFSLKK